MYKIVNEGYISVKRHTHFRRSYIEAVYKEVCPEGTVVVGDSNDIDLNALSEQNTNMPMEVN